MGWGIGSFVKGAIGGGSSGGGSTNNTSSNSTNNIEVDATSTNTINIDTPDLVTENTYDNVFKNKVENSYATTNDFTIDNGSGLTALANSNIIINDRNNKVASAELAQKRKYLQSTENVALINSNDKNNELKLSIFQNAENRKYLVIAGSIFLAFKIFERIRKK